MSNVRFGNISILRAAAVIVVVAYHLNAPWAKSGYLGVTLFFCISGYLVSLGFEKANSADAYLFQRIYRLLPALVALFAICFVLLNLWPTKLAPNVVPELICSAIFAENMCLASNAGYFATNAKLVPITHLWSLALEVQFYVLLFVIFRWTSRELRPRLILALFLLSVVCDLSFSRGHLQESYLFAPSRLWEFLAGCLAALRQPQSNRVRIYWKFAVPVLAVLLICILPMQMTYASYVAGKAIAVSTGLGAILFWRHLRPVAVAEFIGEHSYAIYLAHFPAIVATSFLGDRVFDVRYFCGFFVLFWACIYVADRSRSLLKRQHVRLAVPSLLAVQVAFAILGSMALFKAPEARAFDRLDFENAAFDYWRYGRCFIEESTRPFVFAPECSAGRKVALVGDSHAAQLLPILQTAGILQADVTQATVGGCSIDIRVDSPLPCNRLIANSVAALHPSPPTVVLGARFSDIPDKELESQIGRSIRFLKEHGAKNVIIMGNLPYFHPTAPFLYWQAGRVQDGFMYIDSALLADKLAINKRVSEHLMRVAKEYDARYIDLSKLFCDEAQCKVGDQSLAQLFFSDYDHLTLSGARFVGNRVFATNTIFGGK